MAEKKNISSVRQRIQDGEFSQSAEISTSYLDEDLLIIDNIKVLANPDPVRLKMNMLACCLQGYAAALLNGQRIEVSKGEIFACPPETTVDFIEVSDDFACTALCITNHGIQNILRSHIGLWNQAMYVNHLRVIKMSELDSKFYDKLTALLRLCLDTADMELASWNPFRRELMETLLKSGLLVVCNVFRQSARQENSSSSSDALFNRFLDILQHLEAKHQPVDFFARQLCITPKYLTIICKRHSGKTAIEWITEYTLSDITYYLRSTRLSVKEIALKLGFNNTSFFGKYVKEHFHMSPMKYREQMK